MGRLSRAKGSENSQSLAAWARDARPCGSEAGAAAVQCAPKVSPRLKRLDCRTCRGFQTPPLFEEGMKMEVAWIVSDSRGSSTKELDHWAAANWQQDDQRYSPFGLSSKKFGGNETQFRSVSSVQFSSIPFHPSHHPSILQRLGNEADLRYSPHMILRPATRPQSLLRAVVKPAVRKCRPDQRPKRN
jgi:hypothetical protein